MSDISELLQLNACDTSILRLKKQIDELPEAAEITQCRNKRKELKMKQDQVFDLNDDAESKMKKLQDEEDKVLAKIADFQKTLDTNSDYRVTQKVTRDMEGQVKRQQTLEKEQNELLERQIKIDKLANGVVNMLHELDEKEDKLTEEFKKKGAEILKQIKELNELRHSLISQLDSSLAQIYEAKREEKNGMALAWFEDGHCSVCHTSFLSGDLHRLKQGPNLTECPNCQRLFIVDREYDE